MNNIKKLRNERNMKQSELADYLNVAQGTLSYWESGKYDIDNISLQKLADYFDVTTDYLLGRDKPISSDAKKEPPTIEEALEHQGVTDEAHIKTIKEIVELMRKTENNTEIASELTEYGSNGNRKA